MRSSFRSSVLVCAGSISVLWGCQSDSGADADAGAADAGRLDASTSPDAGGDAGAALDAARDAATAPDAARDATPPVGATCGGFAGLSCPAGEFCNYAPEAGGQGCDGEISDATGTCQPLPEACTFQYDPVCGCDGETYGNTCVAHASGVSVARPGECGQPKETRCDVRSLACRIATPVCAEGEVPSVLGSCYGPCVAIDECDCDGADACPLPEIYTCHLSAGRCGPYVN